MNGHFWGVKSSEDLRLEIGVNSVGNELIAPVSFVSIRWLI